MPGQHEEILVYAWSGGIARNDCDLLIDHYYDLVIVT